jgi:hypothetical protein
VQLARLPVAEAVPASLGNGVRAAAVLFRARAVENIGVLGVVQ